MVCSPVSTTLYSPGAATETCASLDVWVSGWLLQNLGHTFAKMHLGLHLPKMQNSQAPGRIDRGQCTAGPTFPPATHLFQGLLRARCAVWKQLCGPGSSPGARPLPQGTPASVVSPQQVCAAPRVAPAPSPPPVCLGGNVASPFACYPWPGVTELSHQAA